jgi:hypothetical protein
VVGVISSRKRAVMANSIAVLECLPYPRAETQCRRRRPRAYSLHALQAADQLLRKILVRF